MFKLAHQAIPVVEPWYLEYVSELIAFVALVFSGWAFIRSGRTARREHDQKLKDKIAALNLRSVNHEMLHAIEAVRESGPIIRAAGRDYSTSSHSRTYLAASNRSVQEAIRKGGAKDLTEFTTAYSTVMSLIFDTATIAPDRGPRRLKQLWRSESASLYGQIQQNLSHLHEARWELHKYWQLWPLAQNTLGATVDTPLADRRILKVIKKLNRLRGEKVPQLNLPHARDDAPLDPRAL
ncbi:hypothetical protein [Brevibacterium zhoupengii]|uniref:hypothetical protein n=1 Tax=Brevibacterium zhoupengii TaxID=2898795 RepID=UPI001F094469|nr:hypothetical protein [Brevibacterium zhoupengii]